jgi:hypothetical protein
MEQQEIARLHRELEKVQAAYELALQEEPERAHELRRTLEELKQRLTDKLSEVGMMESDIDSQIQPAAASWTPLTALVLDGSARDESEPAVAKRSPKLKSVEGQELNNTPEPNSGAIMSSDDAFSTSVDLPHRQEIIDTGGSGECHDGEWWRDEGEVTNGGEERRAVAR